MGIKPIRSDEDHRAALAEIDACWGAPEGTEAADRLDVLLALVEAYEAKRGIMAQTPQGAGSPRLNSR